MSFAFCSIALCSNATGSEKLPLIVIGYAKMSRCFKENKARDKATSG